MYDESTVWFFCCCCPLPFQSNVRPHCAVVIFFPLAQITTSSSNKAENPCNLCNLAFYYFIFFNSLPDEIPDISRSTTDTPVFWYQWVAVCWEPSAWQTAAALCVGGLLLRLSETVVSEPSHPTTQQPPSHPPSRLACLPSAGVPNMLFK